MKLFEISDQFKALERLEDIDAETLADTLESLTAEFDTKGLSVAAYFLNLDSDIGQLKEAEQRIADRRETIENRSKSLKEYLLTNMQRLEISEISCPEFKITIRKPQKVVNVMSIDWLHDDYLTKKEVVTPNKAKIKEHLKSGVNVNGAELINGKSSLIIK